MIMAWSAALGLMQGGVGVDNHHAILDVKAVRQAQIAGHRLFPH
jgi:hypothetical protein